jgi:hypothetical protein
MEVARCASVEGIEMGHSRKHSIAETLSRPTSPVTQHWIKTLEQHGVVLSAQMREHFPHVLDKIAAAWGNAPAMDRLMAYDLLIDNRGNRQGFPFKVLIEIQELHHLHQALYTAGTPAPTGWDAAHLRRRNG